MASDNEGDKQWQEIQRLASEIAAAELPEERDGQEQEEESSEQTEEQEEREPERHDETIFLTDDNEAEIFYDLPELQGVGNPYSEKTINVVPLRGVRKRRNG